jgi:hypothetical protein
MAQVNAANTSASAAGAASTAGSELWSLSNALFFLFGSVILIGVLVGIVSVLMQMEQIKADWANQRCNPSIMPFAAWFGVNTKDNFDFCLGKTFSSHSSGFMGSVIAMFTQFTTLLQSIFDSLSSMRNMIATLGGGINVIFQEFTDRITNFFFELRMTTIHVKLLMGRLYATLFSVMYMGMSGMSAASSFTNTRLFSFLDTFCFPGDTEVLVERREVVQPMPIREVEIGDRLIDPLRKRSPTTVTSTFALYAKGQAMVQLGSVTVSTNHYVRHMGQFIYAGEHPAAVQLGPWDSEEPLYCLNTTDHTIPLKGWEFLDYDETAAGDEEALAWVERTLNDAPSTPKAYADACFAMEDSARVRMASGDLVAAKDVKIGDRLSTGCQVAGIIRRQVVESCRVGGVRVTPATLRWTGEEWKRFGADHAAMEDRDEFVSFVAVPHSQIELEDGTRVRDYMEVCTPDAKEPYTPYIKRGKVTRPL